MRFGRRPFLYGISIYEERKSTFMSPVTVTENVRKLRQFERTFTEMKQKKIISTTDPRHIGEEEIEAFMGHMRRRELSVVTRRSYIKVLNSFLTFFNNDIIERMRETGQISIATKGEQQPIHFLQVDSLQRIFDAADIIEGPRGIMVRGYMALIFGIAGRPKEVIMAHVEDVDLAGKRFFVRHPKGEGSYGQRMWIPIIREDMIPRIERFLVERMEYLAQKGLESPFLFVNPHTALPMTLNTMRHFKSDVEALSGVRFQLKDFRSSYATITYSESPELKFAISRQMRHAKSDTTESYYIAFDIAQASKQLEGAWKKTAIKDNRN